MTSAGAPAGGDHPPRRGAAEGLLGDDRAERHVRRDDDAEERRRPGDDHPEPRVRDELVPAALEVGEEALALARTAAARQTEQRQRGRAHRERQRVEREDDARIRRGCDHTRHGGPDDEGEAPREAEQCVRLLEPLWADRRGDEPCRRRLEERLRGAVDRHEHGELPHLCGPREEQDGERRLDEPAHGVGDQHDHLSRQPVGPHSSGEHEHDQGQRLRGEHDAEGGRAPVERLDDGEGERDRDEAVSERRGCLPQPEQPELPLPQRTEELTRAHPVTLREQFRVTFLTGPGPVNVYRARPC